MKTYLTRAEALKRYPLKPADLDRLLAEGRINTVELQTDSGMQTIFYDDDLAAYIAERDISPEKFKHLRGNLLGIGEAAREYKLGQGTISQWVKQGKLEVKGEEANKKLVDEADVAYLVALGRAKKMRPGKKVFS